MTALTDLLGTLRGAAVAKHERERCRNEKRSRATDDECGRSPEKSRRPSSVSADTDTDPTHERP